MPQKIDANHHGANGDRIGDSASITLNGGTFVYVGENNNSSTETLGTLTVNSGNSVITTTPTGTGSVILTGEHLARTAGATVNFSNAGIGGALNQLNFTTAPTLTNNILPYATVAGIDFTTFGGTGIAAFTGYNTTLSAGGNVRLTTSDVVPSAGLTVDSLIIVGNQTIAGSGLLSVASGAILATGGSATFAAPVAVGTEGIFFSNTGATAVYDGVISGTTLTVSGSGTTLLNAADTYTGGTTLASGILSIGNPTGLGTGTLNLVSGTIQAGVATTVNNAVTLDNSLGNGSVTFGGNTPLTFSGTTTLTGSNTVTVTNAAGTTFSGKLTGTGGLVLGANSTGTLIHANSTSNHAGGTTLLGGNLVLGADNALGSSTATLSGGALLASTPVTLSNSIAVKGPVAFNGSSPITLSGSVNISDLGFLTVNNTTTVSGVVSGANALAVSGIGTLVLSNVGNTYTGGNTLAGGTLSISDPSALSSGPLSLAGGTLQATAPLTVSNPVLHTGPSTITGSNVTFTGAATLASTVNSLLTINNTTTFAGGIAGVLPLNLFGTGTMAVTAASAYTGTTTVSGGTLLLSGAGALTGTTGLTLNQGGTLTLDNSGTNNANRLPNAASLTLNGGTLNFLGNGGAASTETVGALSVNSGYSTVALTPGSGQTAVLTAASLSRSAGGTINFSGTALGGASNQVLFTAAPALTNGILPYATINGTDFATYGANGIAAFSAYSGLPSGGGTGTENVRLTANTTITQDTTINALVLAGNVTLTINPGVTLTITGGGVLVAGGNASITGGTLAFGAAEGLLFADAPATSLTVNSVISGSGGLSISGGGTVTLGAANAYTGATALNGANLIVGNADALSTGALTVTAGSLQTTVVAGLKLTSAVTLNNAAFTLAGSNPLLFQGVVTLAGTNNTLTVTNTGATVFAGVVAGTANLTKTGAGTLVLSGANTYTGQTFVNAGVVQVQNNTALGAATGGAAVVTSGAAVQVLGSGLTVTKAIVLNGTGISGSGALRNVTGGNNTWTGGITLQSATALGADAGTTLTQTTAAIGGPGDLTKVGAGTVVFNAANVYSGSTTVSAGILNVQNATALGLVTGGVTVLSGATLQVQGAITVVGQRLTLNGTGFGNSGGLPLGALNNVTNGAIWSGNITMTTGAVIGTANATTLFVTGVVGGTDLAVAGGGAASGVTLLNINTFTGNVTVQGGGLTLSNANDQYTGTTTVSGGSVASAFVGGRLVLNLFGTATGSSGFTVNPGSTLQIDNQVVNLTNRVKDTAGVTLNGATLLLQANNTPGTTTTETIGTITLGSGQSVINTGFTAAPQTGATSTLTSAALARNVGATVNFIGGTNNIAPLGLGTTNQLLFTTAPSGALVFTGATGDILPFAEVNGGSQTGDFATYGANGITAFTAYTPVSDTASFQAVAANAIVKITGGAGGVAATITAANNQTIGALLVQNANATATATNVQLLPTGNLTITSGAIMTLGGTSAQNTVTLGAATAGNAFLLPGETFLFQNNQGSGNTNFNGFITGNGRLTVAGANAVYFNTTANTYTGGTNLNAGTAILQGNANLGTGALTLTGGSLTNNNAAVTLGNAVTINGPITYNPFAGTLSLALSGPVTLATGNALTVNTAPLVVTGTLAGTAPLVMAGGNNALQLLNNSPSYSAGVLLGGGTITVGSSQALGTGTITFGGGGLSAFNSAQTITNAVTIPNLTAIISGANNLTFGGTVTLVGLANIATTNVGITSITGNLTGSGALGTAGASATGVLRLASANTYTGGTFLTSGNVLVEDDNAFSSGALVITGGNLLTNTARTITNALRFNAGTPTTTGSNPLTFSGITTLLNSTSLTVNNNATLSGIILESGGARALTLLGGVGTLTVSNPNNLYTGGTVLNGAIAGAPTSTLIVGGPTALGTGTLTLTAGTLQLGAFALATPLALNGGIVNLAGVFTGNVTLNAGTTTILQANSPTTFSGVLSGTGSLALLSGNLTLTNANTYTGTTTVSGGNLILSGGGRLTATTSLALNQGGLLTLDNSASNAGDRINDAAAVVLNGGTLSFQGNSSAAASENLGPVTLGGGTSTITTAAGSGQTATVNLASLTRLDGSGGTLNISATSLGVNNKVLIGSPPTLTDGILPYVTANGSELATYDATAGVASYTAAGGMYTATVSGSTLATDNVRLTANDTVSSSKTINSLTLSGDRTLTIAAGVTLTVTSGVVLATGTTAGASITGGGTLVLGEAIIHSNAGSSLSLSVALSGNNLTLAGGGGVTLSGSNSFSGNTTLASANVTLGSTTAIGAGALTLVSGSLQTSMVGGLLLRNAVTLSNSAVTLAGSNPLLFSGTIVLAGTNNTLSVSNTALTAAINGVVSGAAILTKSGPGTLVLSGTNTYTGGTFVNQGVIQVQNNSALGTAAGATVVASGAAVHVLGSGLTVAEPILLNGTGIGGGGALRNLFGGNNTWSGAITLQSASAIGADGSSTLTDTGAISGVADLTKVGPGTLVLNAASTYSGQTNVSSGIVNIQNSGGLGLAANSVTVAAGATLQLQASVGGIQLTLNGTGLGNVGALPQGALVNQANNNTWGGAITLNSGTALGGVLNTTLTLGGVVSGTDFVKVGAGTIQLVAANTYTGATTVNAGLLILSNSNTYTGATTISGASIAGVFTAGTLLLNLSGTALNSSGFTVNQNSSLTLDNTQLNLTDRVGDSAPVTLNTGTLNFQAMNVLGAASSETLGTITLGSGHSVVQTGYAVAAFAGTSSTLTSAGLLRNPGATVNFLGGTGNVTPLNTTTNRLLFSAALSADMLFTGTQGTILEFAEVGGGNNTGDFATPYTAGAATGIAPFTNYLLQTVSATTGTLNGGANDIVKVVGTAGAATTLTAALNQTVGALLVANNLTVAAALQINTNGNFNVASGMILTQGTALASTVNFQATAASPIVLTGETILFQNSQGGNTNFTGPITGPGSLIIAGNNNVFLGSAVVNTYTGGTILSSGTVINQGSANFGTGTITLNGGTFQTNTANQTFSNAVNLNGLITFTTAAPVFTGPITLTNNATLSPTASVFFNGVIGESGGSRSLTVTGVTSTVVLNNNNTYSGGTILAASSAVLQLGDDGALGTGALTLVSGNLNTNSAVVITNPVTLANGAVTTNSITQGNNLTLAGPITLIGNNTLTINSAGLTFLSGVMSGPGTLNLAGSGVTHVQGTNTYTGGTSATAGTLILSNSNALGTGSVILGATTLIGSTPLTLSNNRILNGGNTTLTGANALTFGGTTTLVANSTFTTNNTSGVTHSGVITESGGARLLTVSGTGTLTLPNPNLYSGGTTLNAGAATGAGTLAMGSNGSLGTGTLTLTAGVLQANSPVSIANAVALNGTTNPVAFTGSTATFTGAVTLSNTPILLATNTTTFSGALTGNVPLTLSEPVALSAPGSSGSGFVQRLRDGAKPRLSQGSFPAWRFRQQRGEDELYD